jgi:hypothetical protein
LLLLGRFLCFHLRVKLNIFWTAVHRLHITYYQKFSSCFVSFLVMMINSASVSKQDRASESLYHRVGGGEHSCVDDHQHDGHDVFIDSVGVVERMLTPTKPATALATPKAGQASDGRKQHRRPPKRTRMDYTKYYLSNGRSADIDDEYQPSDDSTFCETSDSEDCDDASESVYDVDEELENLTTQEASFDEGTIEYCQCKPRQARSKSRGGRLSVKMCQSITAHEAIAAEASCESPKRKRGRRPAAQENGGEELTITPDCKRQKVESEYRNKLAPEAKAVLTRWVLDHQGMRISRIENYQLVNVSLVRRKSVSV